MLCLLNKPFHRSLFHQYYVQFRVIMVSNCPVDSLQFAPTINTHIGDATSIWSSAWTKKGGIVLGCIDGSTLILYGLVWHS